MLLESRILFACTTVDEGLHTFCPVMPPKVTENAAITLGFYSLRIITRSFIYMDCHYKVSPIQGTVLMHGAFVLL